MNTVNEQIIQLWKAQQKVEREETILVERLSQLIKNVNEELEGFTFEGMDEGPKQFSDDQFDENFVTGKNILIHACIPDFPGKFSTMGIFLVRIQKDGSYSDELRFIIDLEKVTCPRGVANVIKTLLKDAEGEYKHYLEDGSLITEKSARETFSKQLTE